MVRASVRRFHVDLSTGAVRAETVPCEGLEEVLGGIARGLRVLETRAVRDPYAPDATLVCNLGLLSGTAFMTGLRTFFHAYSPLKASRAGVPAPMWTAGSGRFGTKLRQLGIDEILLTGRAPRPTLLHVAPGPRFELRDAAGLAGLRVNARIQALHGRHPDAHFAVVGPAGEHYAAVRYAAIALSTVNQLRSGEPKPRFCGRGGLGGVMGSKNLLAIAADGPDPKGESVSPVLKALNLEVARGEGSRRFRDADKNGGGGGTWANVEALGPVHALPEMNFAPPGTDDWRRLSRPAVEAGPWRVRDEACWRCGIKCHKNVHDEQGRFRAKLDYEPLMLLACNLGIYEPGPACDLIALVDELGLDAISVGVTLAYAMEYNRRHPDAPLANGLRYGDARGAAEAIEAIGTGRLPELGQGTKRLGEQTGETGYAMHCKGVELPAYLPQTNPGYPFALAGGHMSMRTYLLLLYERETAMDYWVDAITRRGPQILRDDLLGICKFAGMSDEKMAEALEEVAGLDVTAEDLQRAVTRTFLRGYRLERALGFQPEDYDLPAEVLRACPEIDLPQFLDPAWFAELRTRVLARLDEMSAAEAL